MENIPGYCFSELMLEQYLFFFFKCCFFCNFKIEKKNLYNRTNNLYNRTNKSKF